MEKSYTKMGMYLAVITFWITLIVDIHGGFWPIGCLFLLGMSILTTITLTEVGKVILNLFKRR